MRGTALFILPLGKGTWVQLKVCFVTGALKKGTNNTNCYLTRKVKAYFNA